MARRRVRTRRYVTKCGADYQSLASARSTMILLAVLGVVDTFGVRAVWASIHGRKPLETPYRGFNRFQLCQLCPFPKRTLQAPAQRFDRLFCRLRLTSGP